MGKEGEEGKSLGCWGSGTGGWERKRIAVGKRKIPEGERTTQPYPKLACQQRTLNRLGKVFSQWEDGRVQRTKGWSMLFHGEGEGDALLRSQSQGAAYSLGFQIQRHRNPQYQKNKWGAEVEHPQHWHLKRGSIRERAQNGRVRETFLFWEWLNKQYWVLHPHCHHCPTAEGIFFSIPFT